ncbi:acetyl-CoA carboxylase biotin carboxylase subunit [Oenococcus sp. UCMA 16435]|nr:acetyl-CoA carboxylase biotin carboxylase subunit [Oenococcus sp. UCMA 16435]
MKKVLVANRGEIAIRIIRACRIMHLTSAAIYSTAEALHVKLADQAICIGAASPENSYLNQQNILAAAKITQADAIHPGYGFLSENAEFAKLCEKEGIKFIGPSSHVIEIMGQKAAARKTMLNAGVPIVPGSKDDFQSLEKGIRLANQLGYPLMLKASGGGGGKGMRLVHSAEEFKKEFFLAQNEAKHAFSDGHMYLEKYLSHPRHIEVQVIADQFGNAAALGERDCTIQHRHQKVLEEAPAVALDNESRKKMFAISIEAIKSIHYEGVGTLEFLFEGPGQFYFMEMNTRLQVEHPVTELTSNENIVDLQLRIAAGQKLPFSQKNIRIKNFALECRIMALTPGKIKVLHLPGGNGIRIDTALYQGYIVPANYDALIAKIIAYGPDRTTVISQMQAALDETVIYGIQTNLDFLTQLVHEPKYLDNDTDINWLDTLMENT